MAKTNPLKLDSSKHGMLLTKNIPSPPWLKFTKPWQILVVDDDDDVHNLSRLVLKNYRFDGRPVALLSAYSKTEAIAQLEINPEIAIILLDVVMETDHAGLEVAEYIRSELKNPFIRIILRTGQPGAAPEQHVIEEYDINDYKEKTELTSPKLFTAITTALRSYQDMRVIDRNRQGLEHIIDASKALFELQSMESFATGLLKQLTRILNGNLDGLYLCSQSDNDQRYDVIAGTGQFTALIGTTFKKDENAPEALTEILECEDSILFSEDSYAGYVEASSGQKNILFIQSSSPITGFEQNLIRILSNNLAIAVDNITLNQELIDTQREVIITLGEIVENRSKESANHVKRVANYSSLLGELTGLTPQEIQILHMASPMHDVGKIGIPDAILNKPGKLTAEEFNTMKSHCEIGKSILENSNRATMKAAAIIAHQHHEKWNGKGYPQGLFGPDIHIYARITAIADVFDALICRRCYKEPWPAQKIVELFHQEIGEHFDPKLCTLFLEHFNRFIAIHRQYPDTL